MNLARIKKAIAWWMSAPCDERTAVLLFVLPALLLPIALAVLPHR